LEGQALDDLRLADIAWVPLFVKEPGQTEGEVSDDNIQTIDILPTIADILDLDLPYDVDGRSALGPARATTAKPFQVTDVTPFGVALLDETTIDGPAGWTRVLADTVEAFAPDVGDRWRLFRIGPSPELVGQRVADLDPAALQTADVALLDPAAYASVPGAGRVPALVRGRVHDAPAGASLAVAVNGVIGATGPVYLDDDGQPVFAVMVDDALFRAGENRIDVYTIGGA
jgi:hypothetical protein